MKNALILTITLALSGCSATQSGIKQASEKPQNDKIRVLNFGTFHFGYTPDGTTVDYDENSKSAENEARQLAKMIARFKPTIICVEQRPKDEADLNKAYQEYLYNPDELSLWWGNWHGGIRGWQAFKYNAPRRNRFSPRL